MLKRPFKSVIARIAIVALALSLVFPFIPAALAQSQSTSVDYAENGTGPVATFLATDQDDDPIEWSLSGADAERFTIDGGVLAFKKSPDYENPNSMSSGTQAEKNKYNVTVEATGGSREVVVNVTNVDEDGEVTFNKPQPQVGRGFEATLEDEDGGQTDEQWQWARSADGETWTDIAGATAQSRSPVADDVGNYLRATVTYTDSFGDGKTAMAVTGNMVEARTVANAAPSFEGQDDQFDDPTTTGTIENDGIQINRNVDEGTPAGVNIGKPVSATDADSDVLYYEITQDSTAGAPEFAIVRSSGQLQTKDALTSDNDGNDDTNSTFTVMVKATDPSGASSTESVIITVNDVNDAPVFDADTTADGVQDPPTTLYVTEPTQIMRTGPAANAAQIAVGTYGADDADTGETAANIVYTVTGADAKYFVTPIASGSALQFIQEDTTNNIDAHLPNYEEKSSYSITIVATSGTGDRLLRSSVDVTVMVQDAEDTGSAELSQLEPQVGRAVIATVSDPDGGVTISSWQWYRGGTPDATTGQVAVSGASACPAVTDTTTVCSIPNATSASYIPSGGVGGDVGAYLTAQATYTDNQGTAAETVQQTSAADVQDSSAANTAPRFPDQDPSTAGDQTDETSRSVAENTDPKQSIGAPVSALDDDNDELRLYTLGGADADSFSIDRTNGQLSTKAELDYETKDTYMVVVTATDPSGASASILVTINVTDVDDEAAIQKNVAPQFAADSADREIAENSEAGANVGDPVTATDGNAGDTLFYALSGDGADSFAIDGDGQITVAEGADLDFEAETNSYTVTVTATDAAGESDTITVNISVTNVNETPAVTGPEGGAVNYAENGTDPVGTFTASDPDDGDSVTWSLSGADAGSFEISEDGVLSFVAPAPEEEEPAETNGEETNGEETNGEETNGDDANGDDANGDDTNGDDTNGDDTNGDDTNGDDTNGEEGNGEEMMAFSPDFEMPGDADGDNVYEVTVTATDAGGESASVDVTVTVTDVDEAPVNTAPAFASESVTLSVDENSAAGANVGDPVVATDANEGDEISYTLADESGSFEIWPSGQITVAEGANLDFETQSTYTVTVTASDGTDSSSVEVTINIGNVGLASPYDADDNGAITKAEAVNAVQDYFDDEVSREAVLEVIRTYFG